MVGFMRIPTFKCLLHVNSVQHHGFEIGFVLPLFDTEADADFHTVGQG